MGSGDPSTLEELGWTPFFQQQLHAAGLEDVVPARVAAIQRTHVVLLHAEGVSDTPLGGRWFQLEAEERPAVGDWVLASLTEKSIQQVLGRKSVLKRMSPQGGIQLIAANVDVLFLVTSCNADFNLRRLERYLAVAHEAGVDPVVVLTKADLAEAPERYLEQARGLGSGLSVELVNALDADGLAALEAWCAPGQTVALLGSSGVGKSTLVNTLSGSQVQLTGEIRQDDAKGRHTTTHRSLHLLPSGALLLDSPGIRELAIADAEDGVAVTFDDIESLAAQCRFSDCAHDSEPGCAVQQAIADGVIPADRLASYNKLKREEAYNTESVAERHARSRAFGKMARSAQERKKER
ncbi:MAG: ribosome small subunit-dependent GTPase A [Gammaproteobacteria bacterium]|nr:ribosome small subunit-dependent GTPase A [Gammaproteobacteria bacterium]|tara:strand:- start:70 stop:1122 length:1053 start_codon:yes stop_codon:yes gene_type:complete